MGKNLTQKVLETHLVSGELIPGKEIAITVDQTLTQDATGTMAYLQFEAIGVPQIRNKLSVSYIDHNTLQTGFENADDHAFLQTMAAKYGAYFSRAGNGICHQVHRERFAVPGQILLGSDSHTPTAGGLGMLAIGAGGLDVATAMAGQPYYTRMPKVTLIKLIGHLQPWVGGKDVILEVLRRMTVKGGIGKIIEYGGPGAANLTVDQRFTITNMSAELGATTSLFASDERTKAFLQAQKRERDWISLGPDPDAEYDETIEINLDELEPLIAQPSSPDKVVKVKEIEGTKVDQVAIGSCTNSSYEELMTVAAIMKGKRVPAEVSVAISPGSRQVYEMIARAGAVADLIEAGVRMLESTCGPCIGMGFAPRWGGVSVRTFNRNFPGRSGTANADVYLCGPEVAAATAIFGEITDPRRLGDPPVIAPPTVFAIDDSMIVPPSPEPEKVEIYRGPNIKPLPLNVPLVDGISGKILIVVGDNVSTDDILPAGSKVLPLRSNIPAISEYVFSLVDPNFPARAKAAGSGVILGGDNYGQGSSREHAALAPMFLGVKAVLVKSFARIHRENLINFGILPLTFVHAEDYGKFRQDDDVEIPNARWSLEQREPVIKVINKRTGDEIETRHDLTPRQIRIMLDGGMLNHIRQAAQGES